MPFVPAAVALIFILVTGQIWEDFLITFRHTENLMAGNGLVYQTGERVHGFTSVLNTLLPIMPLPFGGGMRAALTFYQACSLAVMTWGLVALTRSLRRQGGGTLEALVFCGLAALSIKLIAFSTNGQEGGLLVGFISLALAAVIDADTRTVWRLGGAWAGLLYTRPDSPVYLGAIAVVALAVYPQERRRTLVMLARATAIGLLAYLPWLAWAWWYYGSPIPHTIIAKSTGQGFSFASLPKTLQATASAWPHVTTGIFAPIYQPANWPPALLGLMLVAGNLCAWYWVLPVRDRLGRACSAALWLLVLYLAFVSSQGVAYPWYFVPANLLGALVAGRIVITARLAGWRFAVPAVAAFAAACLVVLVISFRNIRVQQRVIEDGGRREIGLWLKQQARPGDAVYAECLGYIGYYYGGKMLDYPGLVAPEVVRVLREPGSDYTTPPARLQPAWIVARIDEGHQLLARRDYPVSYTVVKKFDARPALEAGGHWPGDGVLRHDAFFYVFLRTDLIGQRP